MSDTKYTIVEKDGKQIHKFFYGGTNTFTRCEEISMEEYDRLWAMSYTEREKEIEMTISAMDWNNGYYGHTLFIQDGMAFIGKTFGGH